MNDSAIQAMPGALMVEIETLRDQRDLYRSLLLSELEPLAACMTHALDTVERIRAALRMTTRDDGAFRGKIERLQSELTSLSEAMVGLHLPSVTSRVLSAQATLHAIEQRADISGNDLLPAMVTLEELCSHLLIAADCAAVHLPAADEDGAEEEFETAQQRAPPKFIAALQQLSDKFATEQGKRVALVTMGLEDIPEAWISTLFDLLGQLLRNSIEHGIEAPQQRAERAKPEIGTLVVEFIDRGAQGFDLNMQDDGGGLDAERISEVAVRLGLLSADAVRTSDPARLAGVIFQPGVTTVKNPARRGIGLQIVRDHVQRLGGRIQVAAKRGQFTRYRITFPPLSDSELSANPPA
ncbi:MAG TPA: ATP-binding protein [Steroidobacteraceae bacterium]|jgi:two-component system chemotaxis sensor kinase CheA|nr:ATP-binding protein [Steroidobacteraceae bacterium]